MVGHHFEDQKAWGFSQQFDNGVVGGYDPSNKVMGVPLGNPLFVIRPDHSKAGGIIIQVQTKDNGEEATEYKVANFQEMVTWVQNNLDIMTQLLKPQAPEQ